MYVYHVEYIYVYIHYYAYSDTHVNHLITSNSSMHMQEWFTPLSLSILVRISDVILCVLVGVINASLRGLNHYLGSVIRPELTLSIVGPIKFLGRYVTGAWLWCRGIWGLIINGCRATLTSPGINLRAPMLAAGWRMFCRARWMFCCTGLSKTSGIIFMNVGIWGTQLLAIESVPSHCFDINFIARRAYDSIAGTPAFDDRCLFWFVDLSGNNFINRGAPDLIWGTPVFAAGWLFCCVRSGDFDIVCITRGIDETIWGTPVFAAGWLFCEKICWEATTASLSIADVLNLNVTSDGSTPVVFVTPLVVELESFLILAAGSSSSYLRITAIEDMKLGQMLLATAVLIRSHKCVRVYTSFIHKYTTLTSHCLRAWRDLRSWNWQMPYSHHAHSLLFFVR